MIHRLEFFASQKQQRFNKAYRDRSILSPIVAVSALVILFSATWAEAHRSGCHRWHSCPSDTGSYVCGDLGYCSQCPDNEFCQGGRPTQARQEPTPKPPAPSTQQSQPAIHVQVVGVIDGDTIEVCCLAEKREKVRYIGVNTPETKHPTRGVEPLGKEAAEANRKLVAGRNVRLEFDVERRDRYGRLLAYVYLEDGTFVNAWLVHEGYAQAMTVPPNVRYQDLFLRLQREARRAGRGLWGR